MTLEEYIKKYIPLKYQKSELLTTRRLTEKIKNIIVNSLLILRVDNDGRRRN